jgi:hypothetical protein
MLMRTLPWSSRTDWQSFLYRFVELMVQVAPNLYRKYNTVNRKGTAILYVKMQKAL